jgi:hypothetical protein
MTLTLNNSTQTAHISPEDYHLAAFKWTLVQRRGKTYACAKIAGRFKYLHRLIAEQVYGLIPRGKIVDHYPDPDGLNCQRTNLRLCTRSQNMGNSKAHADKAGKYKGVSLDKATGKYVAQICCNKKHIKIGRYKTAIEAARAYDEKARALFGIYSKANFPQ